MLNTPAAGRQLEHERRCLYADITRRLEKGEVIINGGGDDGFLDGVTRQLMMDPVHLAITYPSKTTGHASGQPLKQQQKSRDPQNNEPLQLVVDRPTAVAMAAYVGAFPQQQGGKKVKNASASSSNTTTSTPIVSIVSNLDLARRIHEWVREEVSGSSTLLEWKDDPIGRAIEARYASESGRKGDDAPLSRHTTPAPPRNATLRGNSPSQASLAAMRRSPTIPVYELGILGSRKKVGGSVGSANSSRRSSPKSSRPNSPRAPSRQQHEPHLEGDAEADDLYGPIQTVPVVSPLPTFLATPTFVVTREDVERERLFAEAKAILEAEERDGRTDVERTYFSELYLIEREDDEIRVEMTTATTSPFLQRRRRDREESTVQSPTSDAVEEGVVRSETPPAAATVEEVEVIAATLGDETRDDVNEPRGETPTAVVVATPTALQPATPTMRRGDQLQMTALAVEDDNAGVEAIAQDADAEGYASAFDGAIDEQADGQSQQQDPPQTEESEEPSAVADKPPQSPFKARGSSTTTSPVVRTLSRPRPAPLIPATLPMNATATPPFVSNEPPLSARKCQPSPRKEAAEKANAIREAHGTSSLTESPPTTTTPKTAGGGGGSPISDGSRPTKSPTHSRRHRRGSSPSTTLTTSRSPSTGVWRNSAVGTTLVARPWSNGGSAGGIRSGGVGTRIGITDGKGGRGSSAAQKSLPPSRKQSSPAGTSPSQSPSDASLIPTAASANEAGTIHAHMRTPTSPLHIRRQREQQRQRQAESAQRHRGHGGNGGTVAVPIEGHHITDDNKDGQKSRKKSPIPQNGSVVAAIIKSAAVSTNVTPTNPALAVGAAAGHPSMPFSPTPTALRCLPTPQREVLHAQVAHFFAGLGDGFGLDDEDDNDGEAEGADETRALPHVEQQQPAVGDAITNKSATSQGPAKPPRPPSGSAAAHLTTNGAPNPTAGTSAAKRTPTPTTKPSTPTSNGVVAISSRPASAYNGMSPSDYYAALQRARAKQRQQGQQHAHAYKDVAGDVGGGVKEEEASRAAMPPIPTRKRSSVSMVVAPTAGVSGVGPPQRTDSPTSLTASRAPSSAFPPSRAASSAEKPTNNKSVSAMNVCPPITAAGNKRASSSSKGGPAAAEKPSSSVPPPTPTPPLPTTTAVMTGPLTDARGAPINPNTIITASKRRFMTFTAAGIGPTIREHNRPNTYFTKAEQNIIAGGVGGVCVVAGGKTLTGAEGDVVKMSHSMMVSSAAGRALLSDGEGDGGCSEANKATVTKGSARKGGPASSSTAAAVAVTPRGLMARQQYDDAHTTRSVRQAPPHVAPYAPHGGAAAARIMVKREPAMRREEEAIRERIDNLKYYLTPTTPTTTRGLGDAFADGEPETADNSDEEKRGAALPTKRVGRTTTATNNRIIHAMTTTISAAANDTTNRPAGNYRTAADRMRTDAATSRIMQRHILPDSSARWRAKMKSVYGVIGEDSDDEEEMILKAKLARQRRRRERAAAREERRLAREADRRARERLAKSTTAASNNDTDGNKAATSDGVVAAGGLSAPKAALSNNSATTPDAIISTAPEGIAIDDAMASDAGSNDDVNDEAEDAYESVYSSSSASSDDEHERRGTKTSSFSSSAHKHATKATANASAASNPSTVSPSVILKAKKQPNKRRAKALATANRLAELERARAELLAIRAKRQQYYEDLLSIDAAKGASAAAAGGGGYGPKVNGGKDGGVNTSVNASGVLDMSNAGGVGGAAGLESAVAAAAEEGIVDENIVGVTDAIFMRNKASNRVAAATDDKPTADQDVIQQQQLLNGPTIPSQLPSVEEEERRRYGEKLAAEEKLWLEQLTKLVLEAEAEADGKDLSAMEKEARKKDRFVNAPLPSDDAAMASLTNFVSPPAFYQPPPLPNTDDDDGDDAASDDASTDSNEERDAIATSIAEHRTSQQQQEKHYGPLHYKSSQAYQQKRQRRLEQQLEAERRARPAERGGNNATTVTASGAEKKNDAAINGDDEVLASSTTATTAANNTTLNANPLDVLFKPILSAADAALLGARGGGAGGASSQKTAMRSVSQSSRSAATHSAPPTTRGDELVAELRAYYNKVRYQPDFEDRLIAHISWRQGTVYGRLYTRMREQLGGGKLNHNHPILKRYRQRNRAHSVAANEEADNQRLVDRVVRLFMGSASSDVVDGDENDLYGAAEEGDGDEYDPTADPILANRYVDADDGSDDDGEECAVDAVLNPRKAVIGGGRGGAVPTSTPSTRPTTTTNAHGGGVGLLPHQSTLLYSDAYFTRKDGKGGGAGRNSQQHSTARSPEAAALAAALGLTPANQGLAPPHPPSTAGSSRRTGTAGMPFTLPRKSTAGRDASSGGGTMTTNGSASANRNRPRGGLGIGAANDTNGGGDDGDDSGSDVDANFGHSKYYNRQGAGVVPGSAASSSVAGGAGGRLLDTAAVNQYMRGGGVSRSGGMCVMSPEAAAENGSYFQHSTHGMADDNTNSTNNTFRSHTDLELPISLLQRQEETLRNRLVMERFVMNMLREERYGVGSKTAAAAAAISGGSAASTTLATATLGDWDTYETEEHFQKELPRRVQRGLREAVLSILQSAEEEGHMGAAGMADAKMTSVLLKRAGVSLAPPVPPTTATTAERKAREAAEEKEAEITKKKAKQQQRQLAAYLGLGDMGDDDGTTTTASGDGCAPATAAGATAQDTASKKPKGARNITATTTTQWEQQQQQQSANDDGTKANNNNPNDHPLPRWLTDGTFLMPEDVLLNAAAVGGGADGTIGSNKKKKKKTQYRLMVSGIPGGIGDPSNAANRRLLGGGDHTPNGDPKVPSDERQVKRFDMQRAREPVPEGGVVRGLGGKGTVTNGGSTAVGNRNESGTSKSPQPPPQPPKPHVPSTLFKPGHPKAPPHLKPFSTATAAQFPPKEGELGAAMPRMGEVGLMSGGRSSNRQNQQPDATAAATFVSNTANAAGTFDTAAEAMRMLSVYALSSAEAGGAGAAAGFHAGGAVTWGASPTTGSVMPPRIRKAFEYRGKELSVKPPVDPTRPKHSLVDLPTGEGDTLNVSATSRTVVPQPPSSASKAMRPTNAAATYAGLPSSARTQQRTANSNNNSTTAAPSTPRGTVSTSRGIENLRLERDVNKAVFVHRYRGLLDASAPVLPSL